MGINMTGYTSLATYTMTDSGWNQLIELVYLDMVENPSREQQSIELDTTLLKYHIIHKMVDCFQVYRLWSKCWPLCQLEANCLSEKLNNGMSHDAAFDKHVRRAIQPTIEDCLGVYERLGHHKDALDYMIKVSDLASPAFIHIPEKYLPLNGTLEYKEPTWEPYHHRNSQLTQLVFLCIRDCKKTVGEIMARFNFYQRIYCIFAQEFWPSYLQEEFAHAANDSNALHSIFSRLLKLELDNLNDCHNDLVTLFGFEKPQHVYPTDDEL
jgi:hypothetical protein